LSPGESYLNSDSGWEVLSPIYPITCSKEKGVSHFKKDETISKITSRMSHVSLNVEVQRDSNPESHLWYLKREVRRSSLGVRTEDWYLGYEESFWKTDG
jgi:hypothetical protein